MRALPRSSTGKAISIRIPSPEDVPKQAAAAQTKASVSLSMCLSAMIPLAKIRKGAHLGSPKMPTPPISSGFQGSPTSIQYAYAPFPEQKTRWSKCFLREQIHTSLCQSASTTRITRIQCVTEKNGPVSAEDRTYDSGSGTLKGKLHFREYEAEPSSFFASESKTGHKE